METVYFNSFSGVDTHSGTGSSGDHFGRSHKYKNLMKKLLSKEGGYYTVPLSGIYSITKWSNFANSSPSSSEMRRLSAGDIVTYKSQQLIISRVSS
jgi:hypothetical protein